MHYFTAVTYFFFELPQYYKHHLSYIFPIPSYIKHLAKDCPIECQALNVTLGTGTAVTSGENVTLVPVPCVNNTTPSRTTRNYRNNL